jgi:hypothetical protein
MLKYYLFVCFTVLSINLVAQKTTIISGHIKNPADRIALLVLNKNGITGDEHLNCDLIDGAFEFKLDLKDPAYFTLTLNNATVNNITLQSQVIEPGDSISIIADTKHPEKLIATGKGAEHTLYQYNAGKRFAGWFEPPVKKSVLNYTRYFKFIDAGKARQLSYLDRHRKGVSETMYQVLKTDIIYECEWYKTSFFYETIFETKEKNAINLYRKYFATQKMKLTDTMAYSRLLTNYILEQSELDYKVLFNMYGGQFSYDGKYSFIKGLTYGKVQERVLATMLILQYSMVSSATEADYLNTKSYDPEFKKAIEDRFKLLQRK